jgi:hypothetical protein
MNDTNKNTRTLIVGFVVAVMALIPMRFIEVGQLVDGSTPQVLGETVVESPVPAVGADQNFCVTKADLDDSWANLYSEIGNNQINEDQAKEMTDTLTSLQGKICE